MFQTVRIRSVRLEMLPGRVSADPVRVDAETSMLASPAVCAARMAAPIGAAAGFRGGSDGSVSRSGMPVSDGSIWANGTKSPTGPTYSHWLLPPTVVLASVMLPAPATPMVGPLVLVSVL